jgi:hypothetical protein
MDNSSRHADANLFWALTTYLVTKVEQNRSDETPKDKINRDGQDEQDERLWICPEKDFVYPEYPAHPCQKRFCVSCWFVGFVTLGLAYLTWKIKSLPAIAMADSPLRRITSSSSSLPLDKGD